MESRDGGFGYRRGREEDLVCSAHFSVRGELGKAWERKKKVERCGIGEGKGKTYGVVTEIGADDA